ncbi:hypothetical protein M2A_1177 [Tepidicaulis marinus]|uniref:Uncharacterized protein n=1 Tax=Tepidicaulis marinus TaxID=1333998 RepID=A0A081B9G0_9HYPH|nr:hypothetical protein M2A_1177 [Tepidicaulis marinus]
MIMLGTPMPKTKKENETETEKGDEVLRRMLNTPPQPKEGEKKDSTKRKPKRKPAE